ncbi:MAG: hypothetical protein EXQ87_05285 [Alphaproteobacteria bacterium]|nr:hypothetical protein [Alphaproteobacteria bacterium]
MELTANGNGFAKRAGWIALLTAASLLFTLALGCAMPVAALAALAALHMGRRDGLALMAVTWLVNQGVGYGLLDYPQTFASFAWGAMIGVSALAALAAAIGSVAPALRGGWPVAACAAFMAAFLAYEGVLYAASAFLPSSAGTYGWPVVSWVLQVNALAFAVLLLIQGTQYLIVHRISRNPVVN